MKTTVFLIRHGETPWNVLGKFQGCNDIDLSENGVVQAHHLKKRFENKFDYIYSSPLKRALETAKILASSSEKNPIVANNLREINFGQWDMDMYHKMLLGNTSVSRLRFDEHLTPCLVTLNDITHLSQYNKSVSFI